MEIALGEMDVPLPALKNAFIVVQLQWDKTHPVFKPVVIVSFNLQIVRYVMMVTYQQGTVAQPLVLLNLVGPV